MFRFNALVASTALLGALGPPICPKLAARLRKNKWQRAYVKRNQDTIKATNRTQYQKNRAARLAYAARQRAAIWSLRTADPVFEALFLSRRRKVTGAYHRRRRAEDPSFKLGCTLRDRVFRAIKAQSARKAGKTFALIGCTAVQLRAYLEARFLPGMSWDNYSYRGWHIDHIRPCASFDLTDVEQQKQCFHYTNLQPLWAADNCKKGARYAE